MHRKPTAYAQITIAKILADLNLVVQYRITIHNIMQVYEILADFNLAVAMIDYQITNFNFLPIFRLYGPLHVIGPCYEAIF